MNTNIRLFLCFLESIFSTPADIPSKTGIPPVMQFLDRDLVQVDYIASFTIPDFSNVKAVSVFEGDKNHGTASRENYSDLVYMQKSNENKYFQTLEENSNLKVKLDPCFPHSFHVTILFANETSLIIGNDYTPYEFRNVLIVLFII